METVSMIIICLILLIKKNTSISSYNYSGYKAISTNTNLFEQNLISTTSDQSVVYITSSGIKIENSTILKSSGDSSNIENSKLYGVNAAVLVQGGEVSITEGEIETAAKGANAICSTNNGKVTISNTYIKSTGDNSARCLLSTYGGSIIATGVSILSNGESSGSLATDKGEGIIICTGCYLWTEGGGSPLIYSTGNITVNDCFGTANASQMIVIEGENTVIVEESYFDCGISNNKDDCGIFLYNSMTRNTNKGISTFTCKDSYLGIYYDIYSSSPMFFVTNIDAVINLESCYFSYYSDIFMNVSATSELGTSGFNGGNVTLNLINQDIEGDIIVDISSSLTINMINSRIKGKINNNKISSTIDINLDSNSIIILTGDSYISSLTNEDSTGSNINKRNFTFTDYNDNPYNATLTNMFDIFDLVDIESDVLSTEPMLEDETTHPFIVPTHIPNYSTSETTIPFDDPQYNITPPTHNTSFEPNTDLSEPIYGNNQINLDKNYFSISNNFEVRIKNYK